MSDEERTPPERVRFTKLQEAQLPDLVRLEQATAAMYHEIGFDAAEVPPRGEKDITGLLRRHTVIVAEADHVVAGYAAFRDEAPGVAYVEELAVSPDFQRFGVGTKLVGRIHEEARSLGLTHLVLRMWERAAWAKAFYAKLGFTALDERAPERVRAWFDDKNAGRPMLRPGEVVLFAEVGEPAAEADEDEPPVPPEDE
jgi:amino-acid N-acetyltransferase